jgi:methylase of polypeptide subunit release factors
MLRSENYRFVTPTPLTHQRVLARNGGREAHDLRDIFGWNQPFAEGVLAKDVFRELRNHRVIEEEQSGWRSVVRAATLDGEIYLHSSFPTIAADAVFFGPDTYRFARAIRNFLHTRPTAPARIADIGSGAGAGAMVVARNAPSAEVIMTDINPQALRFSRINARAAGLDGVLPFKSNLLDDVPGTFDLIVANPPYLNDSLGRTYRHGGGPLGSFLSHKIAACAESRLAPGGSLLMYTGSPIVDGRDSLLEDIGRCFENTEMTWTYEEIDPDVFGEELQSEAYRSAERIAAVLLIATKNP